MTSSQNSSLWQVEDARPEHDPQVRKLFNEVFKQPMSEANWQWKYGENRGVGVVVNHGDEPIAYFGGTERRVVFNGEYLVAVQCGDSMVAEAHRGTLSKKGPFYLSVTSFLGQYVGFGLPYLLSYGFPNARAMRLAERLGMYDEIGNLLDVVWKAENDPAYASASLDFESARHQQLISSLWEEMASEFVDRAIGVRDAEYLKYRYHDHPELDYNLNIVSLASSNSPVGLIVTRKVEDRLLLVDVLAAKKDIRHLVQFGKNLAVELNCGEMYGWLTEVDSDLVADTSVIISETPLRLPLGVYSDGLTADDVRDKWFFMCGDSDFL